MKKLILFSVIVVLLFGGCTKRTANKLVGEWKVVDVGDCGWPDDAIWTFYDDGTLEVQHDMRIEIHNIEMGEYKAFSRSLVTPYIRIKGFSNETLNGNWRVEKVNKEHLIINRVEWLNGDAQAAFLRREFVKQ